MWSMGDGDWTHGSASDATGRSYTTYTVRSGPVSPNGPDALILIDTVATVSPDIHTGEWTGAGFQYRHTAGPNSNGPSSGTTGVPLDVEIGDVDADGDSDVVWSLRTSGLNKTWVSLGKGDGTFDYSVEQSHPETSENWSQFRMFIADVNGDGQDDIIWNHAAGENKVYVALGKS